MNREGVIITSFLIEKPRQVKLFQVKIPREAENIVGIETGIVWKNGIPADDPAPGWTLPLSVARNIVLGEVKFQSYEKANVFYTKEICANKNTDYGDFTSQFFKPTNHTHQYQQIEDPIKVSGSTTILQGVYRDSLADTVPTSYKYLVKVYVWIEAKTDQSNL